MSTTTGRRGPRRGGKGSTARQSGNRRSRNKGSGGSTKAAAVAVCQSPQDWQESSFARIRRVRQSHAQQRAALDADIDSHPLEPQMSGQLLELMRMEEMAGRQGQHERKRMLTAKVDSQMQQETEGALLHIITLHTKQRAGVYKKLAGEVSKLAKQLHDSGIATASHIGASLPAAAFAPLLQASGRRRSRGGHASYLPNVGGGGTTVRSQLNAASMPDPATASLRQAIRATGKAHVDEAAHRAQVQEHWADGERYNLRQAFKSQMERIQADWETYLRDMELEYKTERAKMLGETVDLSSVNAASGKENGHWLSKEKQDTLIHTAPVLAPSTSFSMKTSASANGGGKAKALSAATRRELAALDGRYEEAKRQVLVQQEEALRWTRRQSERMVAQVDAQEAERRQAVAAAAKQEKVFDQLLQAARDVTRRMALAVQTVSHGRGDATASASASASASVSASGSATPSPSAFSASPSSRFNDTRGSYRRAGGRRGAGGRVDTSRGGDGGGSSSSRLPLASRSGAGNTTGSPSKQDSGGASGSWSSRHLLNSSAGAARRATGGRMNNSKSTGRLGNRQGAPMLSRSSRGTRAHSERSRLRSSHGGARRQPRRSGAGKAASSSSSSSSSSRRQPARGAPSPTDSLRGARGARDGSARSSGRGGRKLMGISRTPSERNADALLSNWPSNGLTVQ